MQKSITANEKIFEWNEEITLYNIFQLMGYKLKVPAVLVHVNGELIKKNQWKSFKIPEGAEIKVMNILRGG